MSNSFQTVAAASPSWTARSELLGDWGFLLLTPGRSLRKDEKKNRSVLWLQEVSRRNDTAVFDITKQGALTPLSRAIVIL